MNFCWHVVCVVLGADEAKYALHDAESEGKFGFKLAESLQRELPVLSLACPLLSVWLGL